MYNYLKNYNNSSSFNFRNLFFVERSAKFRRIMSNVGSTFRNSKWTDYSLNNVNRLQHSFEPNTFFNIWGFIAFFSLLVFVASRQYSLIELLFTSPLNVFQDHMDSWTYVVELWTTVTPLLMQFAAFAGLKTFSNGLLDLFLNQSGKKGLTPTQHSPVESYLGVNQPGTNSYVADSVTNTTPIEDYFDSPAIASTNNGLTQIFYNVDRSLSQTNRPTTVLFTPSTSFESTPTTNQLGDNILTIESLSSNLEGSFYLTSLSFQNLSLLTSQPELMSLSQNLTTQDQMINTLRWSYRYNNLHRRTMYNSHKLTEVKTLISAGYFDMSSTTGNVWFSDQYARNLDFGKKSKMLTSINLLKTNWNRLYRPSFGYNDLTDSFSATRGGSSQDALTKLSFYEASFHFFINRVKNFSSLQSNSLSTLPQLIKTFGTNREVMSSTNDLYKHSLANTLRVDVVSSSNLNPRVTLQAGGLTSAMNRSEGGSSDVSLIKKDSDMLYLKTLEILYNITKSNSPNPNTLYTYLYLSNVEVMGRSSRAPKLVKRYKNDR